ncbi:MAG: DJ-1/PfpI family protein [Eubacteriales bacterium]|nr:DJ-1/PfpI family protein [Eubacteriales bacterium]
MVYVHLADGFEEIEALTVVDVLRRGEIAVEMVSMTESRTVRGAHDIVVTADRLFRETDYGKCDMIVLPGGMPGTANLGEHEGLSKQLCAFAQNGKWIAAICAAPSVLGKLSLLKGKRATSYPGYESQMIGVDYREERVVRDGNLITSRGPGTAMEFALELVKVLKNDQTVSALRNAMII